MVRSSNILQVIERYDIECHSVGFVGSQLDLYITKYEECFQAAGKRPLLKVTLKNWDGKWGHVLFAVYTVL